MKNLHVIGKELFITSDEEIKKDDYYLGDDNHIYCLCTTVNSNGKKIILTTNADYIEEGIQAIDDEFLEWFVNNPSCEEVEVIFLGAFNKVDYYKIIIPKEEPKQETLEEAAKGYSERHQDVSGNLGKYLVSAVFQDGANYQAERMYNEEEVVKLWNWLNDGFIIRKSLPTREELIGWFEQFKNK